MLSRALLAKVVKLPTRLWLCITGTSISTTLSAQLAIPVRSNVQLLLALPLINLFRLMKAFSTSRFRKVLSSYKRRHLMLLRPLELTGRMLKHYGAAQVGQFAKSYLARLRAQPLERIAVASILA